MTRDTLSPLFPSPVISVTAFPVCIRMHVPSSCVLIQYDVLEILRSLLTEAPRVQARSAFA